MGRVAEEETASPSPFAAEQGSRKIGKNFTVSVS
jgi:hypothetical protein